MDLENFRPVFDCVKRKRSWELSFQDRLLAGFQWPRAPDNIFETEHFGWKYNTNFPCESEKVQENLPTTQLSREPKPDNVYGFQLATFSKVQQVLLKTFESPLSPKCPGLSNHDLFGLLIAIEWDGTIGYIEQECRRNGRCMVSSRSKAMHRIGLEQQSDYGQYELDSMSFTATVNQDTSYIYVHWARKEGNAIKYYMATVAKYELKSGAGGEEFVNMRRALHNIIEWGLRIRVYTIRSQLDIYHKLQASEAKGAARAAKRRRTGSLGLLRSCLSKEVK